jgi:hypothetical protein
MKPDEPRWLWLTYAAVFVPVVGQAAVVVTSSALYYRWRRAWPRAAFRLNVHAWLAVGLRLALMAVVRR